MLYFYVRISNFSFVSTKISRKVGVVLSWKWRGDFSSLRSKCSCAFSAKGNPRNLSRSASARVLAAQKMGRAQKLVRSLISIDFWIFLSLKAHSNACYEGY